MVNDDVLSGLTVNGFPVDIDTLGAAIQGITQGIQDAMRANYEAAKRSVESDAEYGVPLSALVDLLTKLSCDLPHGCPSHRRVTIQWVVDQYLTWFLADWQAWDELVGVRRETRPPDATMCDVLSAYLTVITCDTDATVCPEFYQVLGECMDLPTPVVALIGGVLPDTAS